MNKYTTNKDESEISPNLLGLKKAEDIAISEFEGFVYAELFLSGKLTKRTKFNLSYILKIHKLALGHLYTFAGKYRTVNMSKGGFVFPAALYLPNSMNTFEQEILNKLPNCYENKECLITDVAKVHAELLFIHPFREGNGRTARLLANLMVQKQGYKKLDFSRITSTSTYFNKYVNAVQMAANKEYGYMEEIIKMTFEDGA